MYYLLTFRKSDFNARPFASQNVVVHDIAGDEDKYKIDSHGFQYLKHESKEKEFLDDDKIKAEYYPETEKLLKDTFVQLIWNIYPCTNLC